MLKKNKCKCGCGKFPTMCFGGYFYAHAPQEIKDKNTDRAKKSHQTRRNRANLASLSRKVHSVQDEASAEKRAKESLLGLWFISVRVLMKGRCECGCGKTSSKYDEEYYKFSICHILPKSKFKSIATHPNNWIELSFWGGCHTTFDNMGYEICKRDNPVLWEKVVAKFRILYPCIRESEKKSIPQVLLDTL